MMDRDHGPLVSPNPNCVNCASAGGLHAFGPPDHFLDRIGQDHPLDVVHPLWLCGNQTNYRRGEILQLMEDQLRVTVQRWVRDKGFGFTPDTVPGLMGTEMWLSIIYLIADVLGLPGRLPYRPQGVHRPMPALPLWDH